MGNIELMLWEKVCDFHGHVCGGLTIGYKVSLYAKELLELSFSEDEDVVCVTENDACGVDAVQVMLGCSVGKGNLLFRLRGKQAFSFFNRKTGKAIRLVLKPTPEMTREQKQHYLFNTPCSELFDVKEVPFELPEKARNFTSVICEECGETTAEPFIHLENGKKVCTDCHNLYTRFL